MVLPYYIFCFADERTDVVFECTKITEAQKCVLRHVNSIVKYCFVKCSNYRCIFRENRYVGCEDDKKWVVRITIPICYKYLPLLRDRKYLPPRLHSLLDPFYKKMRILVKCRSALSIPPRVNYTPPHTYDSLIEQL